MVNDPSDWRLVNPTSVSDEELEYLEANHPYFGSSKAYDELSRRRSERSYSTWAGDSSSSSYSYQSPESSSESRDGDSSDALGIGILVALGIGGYYAVKLVKKYILGDKTPEPAPKKKPEKDSFSLFEFEIEPEKPSKEPKKDSFSLFELEIEPEKPSKEPKKDSFSLFEFEIEPKVAPTKKCKRRKGCFLFDRIGAAVVQVASDAPSTRRLFFGQFKRKILKASAEYGISAPLLGVAVIRAVKEAMRKNEAGSDGFKAPNAFEKKNSPQRHKEKC